MLRSLTLFTLAVGMASAAEPSDGQSDFQTHCMACHQVDLKTVGPSLVAIAKTYPAGKQSEFVAWAKSPGKKDATMIQMPSMAHVPDEALAGIHDYLLLATKGKSEKRGRPKFPAYKEPARKLPFISHAFLPDTSPASLLVVLPGKISLCWDTELCRVRYVWNGDRTRLAAGMWKGKPGGKPFFRETSKTFLSDQDADYLGFRLIDGAPEFHYRFGEMDVRELIQAGKAAGTWQRTFTITNPPTKLSLDLEHGGEVAITSNQGTISGNVLSLDSKGASNFTLNYAQK
ncbi:c-type cytochrome [Verrucomicrobiaceae bacterium 227]